MIGVGRSAERCRQAERQLREATGSTAIQYLVADLSVQSEVRRLAQEVKTATNRLDVLVNNAGLIRTKREVTVDGLEMTFALNHLAYFLLTNLLLDTLKASAPVRIVSVSSTAHKGIKINFDDLQGEKKYSGWRAYQQSKLANILFTRELSRRLEGTGVTANALHPGYVRTQIFRVDGFAGWLLRRAAELLAISPEEGAKTTIYLASSPEVKGQTGLYFVRQKRRASSPESLDDATARKLWDVSARLTGLGPA